MDVNGDMTSLDLQAIWGFLKLALDHVWEKRQHQP